MTDLISYPIIFSAPMVRAILREIEAPGTGKRQTRRLAWGKPTGVVTMLSNGMVATNRKPSVWQKRYERWQAGERPWIYVREATTRSGGYLQYEADGTTSNHLWRPEWKQDPRPGMHHFKEHSRICGPVTDMRLQRLQDISGADAVAEGCNAIGHDGEVQHVGGHPSYSISEFSRLWNSIHGPGAWAKNPEVVVVQFIPQLANIGSIAHG